MNPLTLRFEHFAPVPAEERRALDAIAAGQQRGFAAREQLVGEGDAPRDTFLLLSGWAGRCKRLPDGRQQIAGFILPGDLCDMNVGVMRRMDHAIVTLAPVTLVELPPGTLDEVAARYPGIGRALWWDTLVSASIQREWTISLGRRAATERLAHLLCELFLRLRMVGRTSGNSCDLPLTQADIACATGLSIVHVNRTLQELRANGLIVLKGGRLVIPDLDALKRAALFDPGYLHLAPNRAAAPARTEPPFAA